MKKLKNLDVKTGTIAVALTFILLIALQCQVNKFPTSEQSVVSTYKESFESYVTGPTDDDNEIEFIFKNHHVRWFRWKFENAGYSLHEDSVIIYHAYDEEDSSYHKMYFVPFKHPSSQKEGNILYIREGDYYVVNAFIWEADSGLVDTSIFEGYAESPFLDIWCFLIEQGYAGNRFPPSPGSGGGNKLTDDYCLYLPSVTIIYLPSVAGDFLGCWNERTRRVCGPAVLACGLAGSAYVQCVGIACGSAAVGAAWGCYEEHPFLFILP